MPITKWIPQAAELKVLAGWEGDKPVLRAPASDITLRQLMTHTSGMASSTCNADIVRYGETVGGLPPLDYAKPETWVAQPLAFDPGVRWHYSPSIDWVGRLIVETSGKPLGAYMQENIFAPLGMASTGYAVTPDMAARQGDHQPAGRGWKHRGSGPAAAGRAGARVWRRRPQGHHARLPAVHPHDPERRQR